MASFGIGLGIQSKPCGILNVNGLFDPLNVDPLNALWDPPTEERFLRQDHPDLIVSKSGQGCVWVASSPGSPSLVEKWLDRREA